MGKNSYLMALDNSSDALAAWRVRWRWQPVVWLGSIDVVIARSFACVESVEGCIAVRVCGVASEEHIVSHKSTFISVFTHIGVIFQTQQKRWGKGYGVVRLDWT